MDKRQITRYLRRLGTRCRWGTKVANARLTRRPRVFFPIVIVLFMASAALALIPQGCCRTAAVSGPGGLFGRMQEIRARQLGNAVLTGSVNHTDTTIINTHINETTQD